MSLYRDLKVILGGNAKGDALASRIADEQAADRLRYPDGPDLVAESAARAAAGIEAVAARYGWQ